MCLPCDTPTSHRGADGVPHPPAMPGTLGRRRGPEEIARHEQAVRALHADGLNDGAVAARLGVPVHAAAYLRRKLGLASIRTAGDRSAVTYDRHETAAIVRLREQEGLTWPAIVRALGRGSPSSVELVYDRVAEGAGRVRTGRDRARTRTCLACGGPFRSEWAGNRRCEPCAEAQRGAAAAGACVIASRGTLGGGATWRQAVRGGS